MDDICVEVRPEGLDVGPCPPRKSSSFKWPNTCSAAPLSRRFPLRDVRKGAVGRTVGGAFAFVLAERAMLLALGERAILLAMGRA